MKLHDDIVTAASALKSMEGALSGACLVLALKCLEHGVGSDGLDKALKGAKVSEATIKAYGKAMRRIANGKADGDASKGCVMIAAYASQAKGRKKQAAKKGGKGGKVEVNGDTVAKWMTDHAARDTVACVMESGKAQEIFSLLSKYLTK